MDAKTGEEIMEGQRARKLYVATLTERMKREDNMPALIEPGLYLGSIRAALNIKQLRHLCITHILTVARSLDPAFPKKFIYKTIDVVDDDTTCLCDHFDECINFIDEARSSGGGRLGPLPCWTI